VLDFDSRLLLPFVPAQNNSW